MQASLLVCSVLLLTACERSLEARLVGRWRMPGTSMEIAFRSDHTFTLSSGHTFSGTWHTQSGQLITVWDFEGREFTDTYDITLRGDELLFGRHVSVGKRDGRYLGEPHVESGGSLYRRVR